jgi:hypothetical protein
LPLHDPARLGGFKHHAADGRPGDEARAAEQGDVFSRGDGFAVAARQGRKFHLRPVAPDLSSGTRIIIEDDRLPAAGGGGQRGGEAGRARPEDQYLTA